MYSLERILHHMHLPHTRRPSGFEALALNYGISQIAVGMIGLFGVLFVYELGISWQQGLKMVLLFFGLQRIVVALFVPWSARMIAKLGYRWMMMVGISALAIKAWLLMQVSHFSDFSLWIALFFGGFYIASYYQGFHGLFLQDNDDHKVGEQIGLITMVGRVGLIASPLLAGLLVDKYGFSIMFGVAMSLLIVSLGPIFLMPHHDHKNHQFKLKRSLKLFFSKNGFSSSVIFWYLESGIQTFFWPIFLFLTLGSHTLFGAVGSFVMIINSLAVFYAGKAYDKRPLRRVQWWSTIMVSATYIGRFWFAHPALSIGSDSINRFFSPFWWMKVRRRALLIGEKLRPMEFIAAWEWSVTLGFLLSLGIGYWLMVISNGDWRLMVIPGILGVVMTSLTARGKHGH